MVKTGLFILFLSISLIATAYSQESNPKQQINIVSGKVRETDWVADKLIIFIRQGLYSDEITFVVTNETKITRGTKSISLGDILISDEVTVEYINTMAGLKALRITVKR
ncbi:MAG: hypothetical protein PHO70_05810 [Candidatus Omnitrophica bacterium]|nr:hypothetical protein [Candidatus Omnitrophota bacterium]